MAFKSVEAAEKFVESVDVEDGEYAAAFDAVGRRLNLHVEKPTIRTRFFCLTALQMTPVKLRAESSVDERALQELLITKLGAAGERLEQPILFSALVLLAAERFKRR